MNQNNQQQNQFPTLNEESSPQSVQSVEEQRAIAQVQGQVLVAQKFPRNQMEAYNRIIGACQRKGLAKGAIYSYPKGGKNVTGPSIRLAETIAQEWGHIDYGIVEIEQCQGFSRMMAYAWDLQRNVRRTMSFTVKHKRDTKSGSYELTDSRDIYEITANNGARRVRACIMAIIPGDIIDDSVEECMKTNRRSIGDEPISEIMKKIVIAFDEFGVKPKDIEKRLGHNLDAVIPEEVILLRSIYKSLNDGMAKREDFFDIGSKPKMPEQKLKKAEDKKPGKEIDPCIEEWTSLIVTMPAEYFKEFEREHPGPDIGNLPEVDRPARLNDLKSFLEGKK